MDKRAGIIDQIGFTHADSSTKPIQRWILCLLIIIICMTVGSAAAQDAVDVAAADYQFFFGPNGTTIAGLAVKSDGTILVGDTSNKITEYNSYGESLTVHKADAAKKAFKNIADLLVDPADNLYVVDGGSPPAINVYDKGWALVRTIKPESKLTIASIAYDAGNDWLYTLVGLKAGGNFTQITAYDSQGKVVNSFEPVMPAGKNYSLPGGIALNKDGSIVMGYGGGSRAIEKLDEVYGVRVYKPDGTLVSERRTDYIEESTRTTVGMEIFRYFPTPYGVTVDNAGRIYAYEVQAMPPLNFGEKTRISGNVTIAAANGTLLRKFAVSQKDSPVGAKMALSPDQKTLYVSTIHFVHVISLTDKPEFTTVEAIANVRLRSKPDKTSAPAGAVKAGVILIVTGKSDDGDWLKVRFNGGDAWVAAASTKTLSR